MNNYNTNGAELKYSNSAQYGSGTPILPDFPTVQEGGGCLYVILFGLAVLVAGIVLVAVNYLWTL